MHKVWIALLLFYLMAFTATDLLRAQRSVSGVIEGRVTNQETGEPLHNAHVFLSGTQLGTVTNTSGRYRLSRVPPGSHGLVISFIGFERITRNVVVAPGERLTEVVELEPTVYELDEIYTGNLDERWEKYLDRFTGLFIGETEFADSVDILNPEVLRFDANFWGRFTAEALAPLQIENRALGYQITYYLDEFFHNGIVTRWDGDPHFTEMTPADSMQADYWRQNRRKAFYGSIRHLMIALIEERADEDGFIIYNQRRGIHGVSLQDKRRIRGSRLISEADEENLFNIGFSGHLEIVYTHSEEDPRFVRWAGETSRGPATVQTSFLELNENPITIDRDGEILEPYGATQSGYFSFTRLAELTPREYRPSGF